MRRIEVVNTTRAWHQWHADRDVMTRLMEHLKRLRSARELVEFIDAQDWSAVDANTCLIALHEINSARLREKQGLPAIDDALPHEPPCAFQIVRGIITKFPAPTQERPTRRGPYPGASHE